MVEAPDNSAAVSALNRARDMAAQQDQGHSRLVYSLDGYVYECMRGVADSAIDLEPQPQREHPNSRIGFAVQDAEGQRSALLRRLDLTGSFNPAQVVFHRTEDGVMLATRMPGLLAGIAPQHTFQVVHAGSDRFVVGGGFVLNRGSAEPQTYEIAQDEFQVDDGWLCLEANWKIDSSEDYTLQRKPEIIASRTLAGTLRVRYRVRHDSEVSLIWSSGTCRYPIARVRRGTDNNRPFISQIWAQGFLFGGQGFPAGAFGPTALPFDPT